MTAERIAALPMYDFPDVSDAHDVLWHALAQRLGRDGIDVPPELTRTLDCTEVWQHPGLIFGQACEYPLAKTYGSQVRLVATPSYAVPGCSGFRYSSAIVVRRDDPARSLQDLPGRRCVVNGRDSNSGMNLLRAAVAPHARGSRFFASVEISGSHRQSASMVARSLADVAALDCVSFAHLSRCDAPLTELLRIVAWTPSSPSLPFVTGSWVDDATMALLRRALQEVSTAPELAAARSKLFLTGVDPKPDSSFDAVLALERMAKERDYPMLE